MAEHPIQGIMNVTMDKIHEMVDANTIIGKPITTEIYTHIDREFLRKEILEHHPRSRPRT